MAPSPLLVQDAQDTENNDNNDNNSTLDEGNTQIAMNNGNTCILPVSENEQNKENIENENKRIQSGELQEPDAKKPRTALTSSWRIPGELQANYWKAVHARLERFGINIENLPVTVCLDSVLEVLGRAPSAHEIARINKTFESGRHGGKHCEQFGHCICKEFNYFDPFADDDNMMWFADDGKTEQCRSEPTTPTDAQLAEHWWPGLPGAQTGHPSWFKGGFLKGGLGEE